MTAAILPIDRKKRQSIWKDKNETISDRPKVYVPLEGREGFTWPKMNEEVGLATTIRSGLREAGDAKSGGVSPERKVEGNTKELTLNVMADQFTKGEMNPSVSPRSPIEM